MRLKTKTIKANRQKITKQHISLVDQRGFTLPDVLLAALIFSITLLGLLNYQKTLLREFTSQRYQQRAWLLAHGALENYSHGQPNLEFSSELPDGWKGFFHPKMAGGACYPVIASITPPAGETVELTRWLCSE